MTAYGTGVADTAVSDPPNPMVFHREAMLALSLCRGGDPESGLEVYRKALRNGGVRVLPVALHARMLADAGLGDTARNLLLLGLENGADVSLRGASLGLLRRQDLRRIREEYLDLFRRGSSDTVMVERYLGICRDLGDDEEIARILNPRLIRLFDLTAAEDARTGNTRVDPDAVAAAVMRAAADRPTEESLQALRNNRRLNSIDRLPDPAIAQLMKAVRERVGEYRDGLAADTHPAAGPISGDFHLETWCVISQGDGYTVPHVHPRGWLTGVFYAAAPVEALAPDDDQGALCIGRHDFIPDTAPGWRTLTVAPVPGRLVLMPSYALHWTKPLKQPGLRISIALDVCPDR